MTNNSPSSIVCFKNGFSFISVPVSLTDYYAGDDEVGSCELGPLPDAVVQGTVNLKAKNPEELKIFSISKARKDSKSKSLQYPKKGFSIASFLEANIGCQVELTIFNGQMEKVESGKIVNVFNEENDSFVVIDKKKLQKGELLIDVSKIISVESDLEVADNGNSDQPKILVRFNVKKGTISPFGP